MGKISSVSELLTNSTIKPIGSYQLDKTKTKPIGSYQLDKSTVNVLLRDYADLITPKFQPWFAKCFYELTAEQIHRAASEARQEGRGDHKKLFSHKINALYKEKINAML